MESRGLIAFDLDDTLLDCSHLAARKTSELARQFGYEFDQKLFFDLFGRVSFEDCAKILFPSIGIDEYSSSYANLKKKFPYRRLFDVDSFFAQLLKTGFDIGIVTNEVRSKALAKIEVALTRNDIRDKLLFVIDSQCGFKKKDTEMAQLLRDRSTLHDQIIIVGDSLEDFELSINGDFDFRGVLTGLTTREQFLNAGVLRKSIFNRADEIDFPNSFSS
jgi:phosphoglycolate phosphatase-like HAD superfamily hydrolase